MDALKIFAARITTSKVTTRCQITSDILTVLAKPDLPEAALKGILKVVTLTLSRYHDAKSRRAITDVISVLSEHHSAQMVKCLPLALKETLVYIKIPVENASFAKMALQALIWTCITVKLAITKANLPWSELTELILTQAQLVDGLCTSNRKVIISAGYKKLVCVFRELPGSVNEYCNILATTDANVNNICLIAFCLKHMKNQDDLNRFKTKLLDCYVKSTLMSKTRPRRHVLHHSREIVRLISHDDFKQTILPTMQKMMLRNPEIVIETVGYLLASLRIDLSQYAGEVIKPIAAQLHANSDDVQLLALKAVESITAQVSDVGAAETVVKHLFAVLNGSEGKLTVVNQRQTVLSAIGKVAFCPMSSNSAQELASTVAELFLPYLNQEVHEATLVYTLENLSVWCQKLTTTVPPKLVQQFKSGPGLKSSTSLVRNAYYLCMGAAFNGDTLIESRELLSPLMSVIEKAGAQSSQPSVVTEASGAALILAKLSTIDPDSENKLNSFWNTILEAKKQLLLSDKFLSAAPDSALISLISLAEVLILNHAQRLDKSNSAGLWYKLVCRCLSHISWKVRKHTSTSVRKLLSTLGGGKLALVLLKEFGTTLNEQDQKMEAHTTNEQGDHQSTVSSKNLVQALITLCSVKLVETTDAYQIAFASLIHAHHPLLLSYNCDIWCTILPKLKLEPALFLEHNADKILAILTETTMSESVLSAIETVTRIGKLELLEKFIAFSCTSLQDPRLKTVTLDEYHIMTTPAGELFDKSVISSAGAMDDNIHNIKRESKLYSYEDQVDELRFRKEQEAKRRARGEIVEPKLSKKQQEMKDAQLKKEAEIRKNLKEMDEKLESGCRIISAVFRGDPNRASRFALILNRAIIPVLKSPLAAPRVSEIVVQFAEAMFQAEDTDLGRLLAYSTMRCLTTCCELDKWWCQESCTEQMLRSVKNLAQFTKSNRDSLDSACLAFSFQLLKFNLKTKTSDKDQQTNLQALEIISCYAKLRSEDDHEGPYLLPRLELFETLLGLIATRTGKIHQQAFSALLLVAEAASGEEGCDAAEQDEIDVCLEYLLSPVMSVREACLQSMLKMSQILPVPDSDMEYGPRILQRVYVARFDTEDSVKALAESLWHELGLELDESLGPALMDDAVHHEEVIRKSVCDALGNLLETYSDLAEVLIPIVTIKYEDKLYLPPPVLDNFGRVISEPPPDNWESRCGLALAIGKISPSLDEDQIESLFNFFVTKGLMDRHEQVRKAMLDAALVNINDHGKEHVSKLLPVFEEFLVDAPAIASYDTVRQSVVILMGSLAKHLDKDDPKVKPIIGKLVETLGTPSQQVQEAVANCLPPLVPAISQEAPVYVQKMLQLLLESDRYAERKGAAYGMAGIVKGLGILALKKHGIMTTLQDAIQDKKNPKRREGALFAYEMLCTMLGRLFEPYVVNILPHLLLCFGDSNEYVRIASDDCAKAVMSKLSAHGVKLVLPSLLLGLEEDSWRTKTGSVELLGAMAYCAPKQLSACLPSIVPKLTEVLNDSHSKVQKAGAQALQQIGSVIKNPEIQEIVGVLLAALQEPTKQTTPCLQTLLDTKFVHFIDAPSLALIMPVVQRAFQDRSTETRKMAAQIIGNIYSLTDQKDLSPYLPAIIPGLKTSLLDPVPEVRNVSSRALGAMVKGMGEASFEELLPWLMKTLTTEGSSVDRSGAAQGLAEVMGAMGLEKLEKLMPDIIETAERMDIPPHVRDGYIMMYIYLPTVFSEDFMAWVGPILPSILKALADESEYVRETALKAGQRIINMFAETAIALFLPELENGLFDDNWRIRYSSVQLLGDLLYRLSGVTGKMTTESRDEDDNFGTESSQSAIMESLGSDRRNRVLAGLYMGRSDTSLMVRQASLHVWKVIVPNTPRTLRELLPVLFSLLLGCLASTSYDKRQVAAKTLGDIVRKLGERVLPEIIPILEKGLQSEQSDQRQGVCIGLSEIMSSTNRDHVMVFADSLIPTVRRALIDPLPKVRAAAASTFDNLHMNIGVRALEEILPYLLENLESDDQMISDRALDGLQQVMAVKSRVVLPFMVPQLCSAPVNSRALAILSSVAGESLSNHLNKILPAMLKALSHEVGTAGEQEQVEYCKSVVLSVTDENGVCSVMNELLAGSGSSSDDKVCYAAVTMLHAFCSSTKFDYTDYVPQLLRGMIFLFTRADDGLLTAAWECLNAIVKKLDATEMLQHIANVRQAVRFALMDFKEQNLPGFCLPKKGIAPVLVIFREGLLNGPPEMKEAAATGLAEVIRCTSADALKISVVNMTGPLIRILGDRFSHTVKVAVLETLGLLLGKCGVMLKPFLPQLQTTFIKALHDPNRVVRLKAGSCLGKLTVIHVRVDPLFVELHTGIKNETEDATVRDCMMQALRLCIEGAGAKMSEGTKRQILPTLLQYLSLSDDTGRMCGSACLGALTPHLASEDLSALLIDNLLDSSNVDWTLKHGRSIALQVALYSNADHLLQSWSIGVKDQIIKLVGSDRVPIIISGLRCYGYYSRSALSRNEDVDDALIRAAVKCMRSESNDVKIALAHSLNYTCSSTDADLPTLMAKLWISALVNLTKEKNTSVKTQSEYALINVLELTKTDSSKCQAKIAMLDPGMREATQDVVSKTLHKIVQNADKIVDIDDTLLK